MRDLLVTAIIFGSLPFILTRPWLGLLMWAWVSFMNPHRLAWSYAVDMPFVMFIAAVTLVALFISKEARRPPRDVFVILWALFITWTVVTTVFALEPFAARAQLSKTLKIQLFILILMMLAYSRARIEMLVWVIVVSVGFFSVKGGIFTLVTGGGSHVYGPPGGFIQDNNALATATLMVIPLMNYLRLQAQNVWIQRALLGAMVISVASALGSQSRGALVAGIALLVFFWLKSKHKAVSAISLMLLIPPLILSMPQSWVDRMSTITSGQADSSQMEDAGRSTAPIASRDWLGFWPSDSSALGRVNAWNYAINVANARPTGAGFESWGITTFQRYAPIPERVHAAHSIYFSVLADHGWIGLILFVSILFITWKNARWIIRQQALRPDLAWARDLARMIQLSMISYCVGGAFLSLSYYDLPWALFATVALTRSLVADALTIPASTTERQTAPAVSGRPGTPGGVTHGA